MYEIHQVEGEYASCDLHDNLGTLEIRQIYYLIIG